MENITDFNVNSYIDKVVKINDLNAILDKWMILIRPKASGMSSDEGILKYVGTELNEESDKLHTPDNIIIPIYHDSMELEGDVFYDE